MSMCLNNVIANSSPLGIHLGVGFGNFRRKGCQHCWLSRWGQINIHTLLPACDTWVAKSMSTFQKQHHPNLPLLLQRGSHLKIFFSWSFKVSKKRKEKNWGLWNDNFLVLNGNARKSNEDPEDQSSSVKMCL